MSEHPEPKPSCMTSSPPHDDKHDSNTLEPSTTNPNPHHPGPVLVLAGPVLVLPGCTHTRPPPSATLSNPHFNDVIVYSFSEGSTPSNVQGFVGRGRVIHLCVSVNSRALPAVGQGTGCWCECPPPVKVCVSVSSLCTNQLKADMLCVCSRGLPRSFSKVFFMTL